MDTLSHEEDPLLEAVMISAALPTVSATEPTVGDDMSLTVPAVPDLMFQAESTVLLVIAGFHCGSDGFTTKTILIHKVHCAPLICNLGLV